MSRNRRPRDESRSQFFHRAVEAFIVVQHEDERDRQYAAAYRAIPESPDEGLLAASILALSGEPWEEDQREAR